MTVSLQALGMASRPTFSSARSTSTPSRLSASCHAPSTAFAASGWADDADDLDDL